MMDKLKSLLLTEQDWARAVAGHIQLVLVRGTLPKLLPPDTPAIVNTASMQLTVLHNQMSVNSPGTSAGTKETSASFGAIKGLDGGTTSGTPRFLPMLWLN